MAPARPSRASRPRLPEPARPRPRSTSTTPTACGCRSCSPRPGVGSRRVCEDLIAAGPGRGRRPGRARARGADRPATARSSTSTALRVQLDEDTRLPRLQQAAGRRLDDERRAGPARRSATTSASRKERLFHVGRLDADTEGLLLLTNDGDLAHRLQHPSYGVLEDLPGRDPRAGAARRRQAAARGHRARGRAGRGRLASGSSTPQPGKALVEVVLHEGRKHVVRRLLEAVGHPVLAAGPHRGRPDPPRRAALGQDAPAHHAPRSAGSTRRLDSEVGLSGTPRYGDVVSDSIPDAARRGGRHARYGPCGARSSSTADEREHLLESDPRAGDGGHARPTTSTSRTT